MAPLMLQQSYIGDLPPLKDMGHIRYYSILLSFLLLVNGYYHNELHVNTEFNYHTHFRH